jgi:hypothetical protein
MFRFKFFKRKRRRCALLPAPKEMKVNVDFQFAKVYNVEERIDVVLGQKFSLYTDADPTPIEWFANNDEVLQIKTNGSSADVEALSLGTSIIQIQDEGASIVKKLVINIVSEIVEPAKTLGVTAEPPVPKP